MIIKQHGTMNGAMRRGEPMTMNYEEYFDPKKSVNELRLALFKLCGIIPESEKETALSAYYKAADIAFEREIKIMKERHYISYD